jgi:hypothetical protein
VTEGMWIALIMGCVTLLGAIGTGLARVINLLLSQSKETVVTLKDERDYWRSVAERCRDQETERPR